MKRIYTDSDVRDSKTLETIEIFARQIYDMIQEQELVLPPNYELVLWLEWRHISGGYNWVYYFVDHDARSLFWVQELDKSYTLRTMKEIAEECEGEWGTIDNHAVFICK